MKSCPLLNSEICVHRGLDKGLNYRCHPTACWVKHHGLNKGSKVKITSPSSHQFLCLACVKCMFRACVQPLAG